MNMNRHPLPIALFLAALASEAWPQGLQGLDDCRAVADFRNSARSEERWIETRTALFGKAGVHWSESDWQQAVSASERCLAVERATAGGMYEHLQRYHRDLVALWPDVQRWQSAARERTATAERKSADEKFAKTPLIGDKLVQPTYRPSEIHLKADALLSKK